jgi:aminopeptidase N
VLDKWFGLQILNAGPDTAAETAARLTEHPDFTLRNPNRFRAVLGALAGFPAGFHHVSGRGYRLMADMLIALDPLNPQTTARICTAFETWRRLDRDRQAMILAQIDRILAAPGLSRDTTEMLSRIREG